MEFKGTKGKWKKIDCDLTSINCCIQSNGIEVSQVNQLPSKEISNANAQLIAAAPELLESLQEMTSIFKMAIDNEELINKAEQAIKKAIG